jgi:hypothetical protein
MTAAPPTGQQVSCGYEFSTTGRNSFFTVSSLGALILALIDPVILQVPAELGTFAGTFDAGSGPRPLAIQSGLTAIPVQPGTYLRPEAGQQLVIVDLPDDFLATLPTGAGPSIRYTLRSLRPLGPNQQSHPIQVKGLYAGRIDIRGQRFYLPTFPCVTSFANVPAVTIPVSNGFAGLDSLITSLVTAGAVQGCNGTVYD